MIEKIKKYYLIFMMYAIIGWIYEVFLEVVVYRWGFTNRGVMFGPYCPVYGFGALLFIFTVYKLLKNKSTKQKLLLIPVVFLLCMLEATLLELITSYICELTSGSWPWQTYKDYKINFQGRIALSPSIRFGIGGVVFLYILQPLFEKLLNNVPKKALNIIFYVILIVFIIDAIFTWII
jgi:uncharacterized membrane protein